MSKQNLGFMYNFASQNHRIHQKFKNMPIKFKTISLMYFQLFYTQNCPSLRNRMLAFICLDVICFLWMFYFLWHCHVSSLQDHHIPLVELWTSVLNLCNQNIYKFQYSFESAGLEPVLSHTDKTFSVSYPRKKSCFLFSLRLHQAN